MPSAQIESSLSLDKLSKEQLKSEFHSVKNEIETHKIKRVRSILSKKTLFKLIVSVLMLFLVFRRVDLHILLDSLSGLSGTSLVLMVVIYLAGQLISSYKWHCIVNSSGTKLPFLTAFRAYFFGMFVNIAGIGTVGADMTRALVISSSGVPKTSAFASVIADRIQGLFVLSIIGVLAILFLDGLYLEPTLSYSLMILTTGLVLGWFVGPWAILKVLPKEHKWRKKLKDTLSVFPRDIQTISKITALSCIFHVSQICLHGFILYALSIEIPWTALFTAIPFVNIASSLPISWQGLGVRENAYRVFFVPSLLNIEQCVALGTLWFFSMISAGLIGGLAAFLSRESSSKD